MSWIQKLYDTYQNCEGREPEGMGRLMPIGHTTQQAQIEIVIDGAGSFRRASVLLDKNQTTTMIPCTEESGGRTGKKPVNHPLCDKLQYVAGDFVDFGGTVTSGFSRNPEEPHREFLNSLRKWDASSHGHPKLRAILRYVEQGQIVADLVKEQILPVDAVGKLLKKWTGDKNTAPPIFGVIQEKKSPEDAFVRWCVEEAGVASSGTWDDVALIAAWISFYRQTQTKSGYCMVTGNQTLLAVQHPARLRHGRDQAKLISSNDTSDFTYRGRFLDADEAVSVGFEVSQKAHNALRWLIKNQAFRNGNQQAIVSWAVSGKLVPRLVDGRCDLFAHASVPAADTAQAYGIRLARAIAGYRANISATELIVVMGMDSATPGRMGITFYRELKGSEFLERIESWHQRYAWLQNFGKKNIFFGAPAPLDVAEAAYGTSKDRTKLREATVERLLPCIADGRPMPADLVLSATRRAANRIGMRPNSERAGKGELEWEKCLGIACALFKGFHIERKYDMALEQDRQTRDYLYGRLLAVADDIESYALRMAKEQRDTTAARLMQRFADHPASTWRTIRLALCPYMARLRAGEKSAGFLVKRNRLLDEVVDSFQSADFTNDSKLTGEFLLGYHCQRQALRYAASPGPKEAIASTGTEDQGDME